MTTLSIDIETYSGTDLSSSGVYKYVEDPKFEILLLAYSFDGGETEVWDLKDNPSDRDTFENEKEYLSILLKDPNILKTAWNAAFEITCISKYFGIDIDPSQWECTMVKAAYAGLPLGLSQCAKAIGQEEQKMAAGKALIKYFCEPCKPTKVNGGRTRNLPNHDAEKWETFKSYCAQDVVTEMSIKDKLSFIKPTEKERRLWVLDQQINKRGIGVNMQLAENAISIDAINRDRLTLEAKSLTGLDNPNSPIQLINWINAKTGKELKSLDKEAVNILLCTVKDPLVLEVLKIRQEMGKTSVKKYAAIKSSVCSDNRVRGLLQFGGANRTMRWAGRIVQMQNLPRNYLEDLDLARELVLANNAEMLQCCFGDISDVLSQLIRTTFVAKKDHTFGVADFSAIEARVIAWLAGEEWVLEVFRTHGKIYEASAAQMFHVALEDVDKELRSKGKVATLALGFQGGVGALSRMDTSNSIPDEEKQGIVDAWRKANPRIVQLWYAAQKAALKAVREGTTVEINKGIKFIGGKNMLFIELPSGRRLSYVRPRIIQGEYGDALQYWGTNQETKQWGLVDTYGGKLVENCLAGDTRVLTERGWRKITHVRSDDKLWDGLKWVNHEGLVYKGLKHTISVDGVRMTPAHKILTNGKWKDASQSSGYCRYEDSLAYSFELLWFRWKEIYLEYKMRLRKNNTDARFGVFKRKATVVRMSKIQNCIRKDENPRNVATSGLCSVARNACSMQQSKTQSLGELRRSWNYGLPTLARKFRELLGRYGRKLYLWLRFRSGEQYGQLREVELPLGNCKSKQPEQKNKHKDRNSLGANNSIRSSRNIGDWKHNFALSLKPRSFRKRFVLGTGFYEPVYDLKNSGELHRFTVKAENGRPFIVHNCVQAIARDCLAETMLRLDEEEYDICVHVHDEVIIECPKDSAKDELESICTIMGQEIEWAKGLPLNAEGYLTDYYLKQ